MKKFTVVIEEDEDGIYCIHVPSLPGCHTQGETKREALKNAREAAGDQYVIKFGAQHTHVPLTGAVNVGPVIIAPKTTHTLLFYMWIIGLSTTAPTGDIVVGWWER